MIPQQFEKTVRNVRVKIRCKTLMSKKCTCTLRIDQSRYKSVDKYSVFIIFECSHDAVSKMCRLKFHFQNLSSSNLPAKMCRFRVNGRPIRHIFHRFQNVPPSCENSLSFMWSDKFYQSYFAFCGSSSASCQHILTKCMHDTLLFNNPTVLCSCFLIASSEALSYFTKLAW